MPKQIDLTGRVFGRLKVQSFAGKRYWNCACECGNERRIYGTNLTRGLTESCGCLARERTKARNSTHGYTRGGKVRSEYSTWAGMIGRCHNPNWVNFADYGGRGVTVCDRWRASFESFLADMGNKPSPAHTLEREEQSRPYELGNCRWATRREQARNRRSNRHVTYRGKEMLLSDALAASGISETGFYERVKKGWTDTQALETPHFKKPPAAP